MTRLSGRVAGIGLTKHEGSLEYLDGNDLYFTFDTVEKGRPRVNYAKVNLETRKTFATLDSNSFPSEPKVEQFKGNFGAFAYGMWLQTYSTMEQVKLPVNRESRLTKVQVEHTKFSDFASAWADNYPNWDVQRGWFITEGFRRAVSDAWKDIVAQKQARLDASFVPMRRASDKETDLIAGIFNFDGDKKSFVQGLSSSGVNVDSLKVEVNFITKAIKGIDSVETLIFG